MYLFNYLYFYHSHKVKHSCRRIMEILYGAKNGVHMFGYNSTESELIWMKSAALWAHCWRLAQADFVRDLCSSDSLKGSRNFLFFCQINNAWFHRFPVRQILWLLNTSTSIGEVGTEFWKFYRKGSFFQKMQKLLRIFPDLVISDRHISAMITDHRKFTTKLTPLQYFEFLFLPLESIQSLFPWLYAPYRIGTYPNFRQHLMSDMAY